jgi:hypothetical protein
MTCARLRQRWRYGTIGLACAETQRASSQTEDRLDLAGQAILNLLHKAAGAAEGNTRRAGEIAQTLSAQLRASENKNVELQAENQRCRERSERAERWLRRIHSEIQENLIRTALYGKDRVSLGPPPGQHPLDRLGCATHTWL